MTILSILKKFSLVAAGTVALTVGAVEAAEAVGLKGSFQFNGTNNPPITTVDFSANTLDFRPDSSQSIDLALQTESFTAFSSATIYDILDIDDLNSPGNSVVFMDLGTEDGFDLLSLTELGDYDFDFDGSLNISKIDLGFKGFFTSASNEITDAVGTLTFQVTGDVEQVILGGGTAEATFSGLTVGTEPVPEPLTILGSLSALGVGTVLKKKQKKA